MDNCGECACFNCLRGRFVQYGHYFDRLLEKKEHVLSQKEEELLAGAGEIFAAGGETFEILDII